MFNRSNPDDLQNFPQGWVKVKARVGDSRQQISKGGANSQARLYVNATKLKRAPKMATAATGISAAWWAP